MLLEAHPRHPEATNESSKDFHDLCRAIFGDDGCELDWHIIEEGGSVAHYASLRCTLQDIVDWKTKGRGACFIRCDEIILVELSPK